MSRIVSAVLSFLTVLLVMGAAFAEAPNFQALSVEPAFGPAPVQLKSQVSVTDDVIRAGDLWDNIGAKAETPVARAPQPGRHLTLDARWLAAVASNTGINWRPASNYDRSIVDRAGQSIDLTQVESELREALTLEGLPKGAEFEISNRSSLSIVIPTDQAPTIAIKDLTVDQRTQRFSAIVEAPAGSPQATRVKVTGRTFLTTRIPALVRAMNRGDTISERDIIWIDVRDDALRNDCATDPHQLIGMEPKSLMKAGVPLRLPELQRPVLVARNSLVTLILQTPFMTLTAQGHSADEGGMGDIVKVTNIATKQVVEGRVRGAGTVVVAAAANGRPIAAAY